ncbi:MAG: TetR/AcrR family transcriptional regulator [Pseudomonadota bacterium]
MEYTTKSKLLQAGIKVFSNHGYAGGSIRQIVDLAGTNIASVTYHYGSKKQLWQAVFTHLQNKLIEAILVDSDKWRDMAPYDRVKSTTRNYVRFCARYPELHRISMFETIHGGEMLDWMNERKFALFSKKSMEWVSLAQDEGVYSSDVSAIHLHFIVTHASNSIFLLAPHIKATFGIDVFEEEQIEKFTDAMISLFLNSEPNTDLGTLGTQSPSATAQDSENSDNGQNALQKEFFANFKSS